MRLPSGLSRMASTSAHRTAFLSVTAIGQSSCAMGRPFALIEAPGPAPSILPNSRRNAPKLGGGSVEIRDPSLGVGHIDGHRQALKQLDASSHLTSLSAGRNARPPVRFPIEKFKILTCLRDTTKVVFGLICAFHNQGKFSSFQASGQGAAMISGMSYFTIWQPASSRGLPFASPTSARLRLQLDQWRCADASRKQGGAAGRRAPPLPRHRASRASSRHSPLGLSLPIHQKLAIEIGIEDRRMHIAFSADGHGVAESLGHALADHAAFKQRLVVAPPGCRSSQIPGQRHGGKSTVPAQVQEILGPDITPGDLPA